MTGIQNYVMEIINNSLNLRQTKAKCLRKFPGRFSYMSLVRGIKEVIEKEIGFVRISRIRQRQNTFEVKYSHMAKGHRSFVMYNHLKSEYPRNVTVSSVAKNRSGKKCRKDFNTDMTSSRSPC